MAYNPKSKENLKYPIDNSDEEINRRKSEGKIEQSKIKNMLYTARTLYDNAEILPQLVTNIQKEVEAGKNDNAIKFFGLIKENETQNINLNGGVEVQKVFIDSKTKKCTDKHIDDFLNDK